MKKVLEGSHAVAEAARLAKVQVIAAYPITPQTHIVEALAQYCADGTLKARFINVESEHSAMAAVIGAASGGARAFTASSSHGLAYTIKPLSGMPTANTNRPRTNRSTVSAIWTIRPGCGRRRELSRKCKKAIRNLPKKNILLLKPTTAER